MSAAASLALRTLIRASGARWVCTVRAWPEPCRTVDGAANPAGARGVGYTDPAVAQRDRRKKDVVCALRGERAWARFARQLYLRATAAEPCLVFIDGDRHQTGTIQDGRGRHRMQYNRCSASPRIIVRRPDDKAHAVSYSRIHGAPAALILGTQRRRDGVRENAARSA